MGISAVASTSINSLQSSQSDNGWQQFAQLAKAVQSGDLNAAQQAYTSFTQTAAGKAAASDPNSPLGQALSQIGQALQSGDVNGAQQALSSLKPHGHHHHHRGGGEAQSTSASPSSSAVPADPNAPGAALNLTV